MPRFLVSDSGKRGVFTDILLRFLTVARKDAFAGKRKRFMLKIGMDVGSTTLKAVVLNEKGELLFKQYRRHFSQITEKIGEMLKEILSVCPEAEKASFAISGSAGMGFAEEFGIPFVQEVFATKIAVKQRVPDADCIIELGGEDAKILFVSGLPEVRMNGTCAGGTGSFIDQMATLLGVSPDDMNTLAEHHTKIYSIASRCGVFAKSDIQPLINQGALKEDIAASIFYAVVNQTVSGLAQGRKIEGKVVYLGGPLTFLSSLRDAFDKTLGLSGVFPENSLYFVALGAAYSEETEIFSLADLIDKTAHYEKKGEYLGCAPLFASREEYDAFYARHHKEDDLPPASLGEDRRAYIGIDAGSTTIKAVLINENEEIVLSSYQTNSGNPVPIVKGFLETVYATYPDIRIMGAASTGYGEEMIKNAFHLDFGVVETMAHFTAAKKYEPKVDFIIDIGGQDIKCFQIRGGVIDNIFLNEACSSGCGSFLQTFAGALGHSAEDFSRLALFADKPVDLGSRCTVFMNSSVKQAQKDGASVENISAGLCISVVKNALYKVIRVSEGKSLGEHIVVQGGTFLNDAVLRAFETELGREVIRPAVAGKMGAFGAALYAKEQARSKNLAKSGILDKEGLRRFTHTVQAVTCKGCTNRCKLTVNLFDGGRRFIGGNRCEKPNEKKIVKETFSLWDYKRELLSGYSSFEGERETIGLPMVLNFFELLPFWHTLFKNLGFGVKLSPPSTKKLYLAGQNAIPSDTVCYPAKLAHGHIQALVDEGVKTIFYPCLSYNMNEGLGDNHFNCPVVAYYPRVIAANTAFSADVRMIYDDFGIHRPKDFTKHFHAMLEREFGGISFAETKTAVNAAYAEYEKYMAQIREKGEEFLALAKEKQLPIIVLTGRPYHLDKEINHGIDDFIKDSGIVVLSEDSLGNYYTKRRLAVLNQWTYHARLYGAAHFVAEHPELNINFVQLVSFGCGVDAITTDEVRRILEGAGKIYTQIKIDEITNLGAVKIRLRSLFAALEG